MINIKFQMIKIKIFKAVELMISKTIFINLIWILQVNIWFRKAQTLCWWFTQCIAILECTQILWCLTQSDSFPTRTMTVIRSPTYRLVPDRAIASVCLFIYLFFLKFVQNNCILINRCRSTICNYGDESADCNSSSSLQVYLFL